MFGLGLNNRMRRRFRLTPFTQEQIQKIATSPSYRAPSAADLHDPSAFVRPREQRKGIDFSWCGARDLKFHDGNAIGMSLSGRAFLSHYPEIAKQATLRNVKLVAIRPYLDELVRSPHLKELHSLDLSNNRIGKEGMALLAQSVNLVQIRELHIGGNLIGDDGIHYLIRAPWFEKLEKLDISFNAIGNSGLNLLQTCRSNRLRSLNLSGNKISEAFRQLQRTNWIAQLTKLQTAWCDLTPGECRDFLAETRFKNLQALDLRGNALGGECIAYLNSNETLASLRSLDMSFNDLGDIGVSALARCRQLRELKSLKLAANRVGPEGARAFATSDLCLQLQHLHFHTNPIENAGLEAILKVKYFPRIESLDLGNCDLGAAGIAALANSRTFENLQSLSLAWNQLDSPAIQILTQAKNFLSLQSLDLQGARLSYGDAQALSRARGLCSMRRLILDENHGLPNEAIEILEDRFGTIRVGIEKSLTPWSNGCQSAAAVSRCGSPLQESTNARGETGRAA